MRNYYYPAVSLGEHCMLPSYPELIQRNLSTMKYHMRQAQDVGGIFRKWYLGEAQKCIREHNRLVQANIERINKSR